MQYSNTSTKAGIIQMIEQTTGLGDATITGNTAKFAYFNNLVNDFYRIAAFIAWKADKNWSFDDSNHTTFPQATTTIVNGQRDYTLASTALRINQVEVMDISGNYYTLEYMHEDDSRLNSMKEQEVSGTPTSYRLVGNALKLYPAPSTTVVTATNGLRVTTDREVDPFTVSDTTQEPGLPLVLQPILHYGPSYVWAMTHGISGTAQLCDKMLGKFPGLMDMVGTFFAERNQNNERSIRRSVVKYT